MRPRSQHATSESSQQYPHKNAKRPSNNKAKNCAQVHPRNPNVTKLMNSLEVAHSVPMKKQTGCSSDDL
eukprot:6456843-Amphidinium_carterae.1